VVVTSEATEVVSSHAQESDHADATSTTVGGRCASITLSTQTADLAAAAAGVNSA
jgi:hypothetical protein